MDLNFSMVTRPVERLIATVQNGLEVLRLGGLETGTVPSPFQTVESVPMYKLRRYFPPDSRGGRSPVGPPVLMVHPMMMSADMWDITREDGAVGILHANGLDPWVIDFGEPDKAEGGMRRHQGLQRHGEQAVDFVAVAAAALAENLFGNVLGHQRDDPARLDVQVLEGHGEQLPAHEGVQRGGVGAGMAGVADALQIGGQVEIAGVHLEKSPCVGCSPDDRAWAASAV